MLYIFCLYCAHAHTISPCLAAFLFLFCALARHPVLVRSFFLYALTRLLTLCQLDHFLLLLLWLGQLFFLCPSEIFFFMRSSADLYYSCSRFFYSPRPFFLFSFARPFLSLRVFISFIGPLFILAWPLIFFLLSSRANYFLTFATHSITTYLPFATFARVLARTLSAPLHDIVILFSAR